MLKMVSPLMSLPALWLNLAATQIDILSADLQQITLQLTVDEWSERRIEVDGKALQLIGFDGAEWIGEVGAQRAVGRAAAGRCFHTIDRGESGSARHGHAGSNPAFGTHRDRLS